MSIFISGSLAFDRIMDFPGRFSDHILPDKIHVLNVCFNVNGVKEHFGGTAGNIAYGLSLLGERPVILSSVGNDFGSYRTWLERNNLPCSHIRVVAEELTAGAYITTDQSDNQITGFNPGAMKHPTDFDVSEIAADGSIGIIAAGNLDDMTGYARRFREKNIFYILDPGQSLNIWDGDSLRKALAGSSIFISNDYELELAMNLTGLTLNGMLENTGAVITTKGDEGSVIVTREVRMTVPAVPAATVLDPTGAGDAYRAGLIRGLVGRAGLLESCRLGAALASFAVQVHGTQEYRCSVEQVKSRYQQVFGPMDWL